VASHTSLPGIALAASLVAFAVDAVAERPPPAPLCGDGPLEILLTNDDGVDAPGIRALYARLREAGHHVLVVAPGTNASGSSSSFTWGSVRITRDPLDPNVVGIAGTPATAVVLGATALYPPGRRPDLVISGINDGPNSGSLLVLSGTVGAALAGTTLLAPPVPGIAVNADRPSTPAARQALPADHVDQVARHLTRLLGTTRGWFCDHGRVARSTVVLNVNYPALPTAEMRGVRVASQGRSTDLHLKFEASGDDVYASRRSSEPVQADAPDSDTVMLGQGYVTVTPLDAVLQSRDIPLRDLQRRLSD
jgi:5'/3'-nucleotidase SurE